MVSKDTIRGVREMKKSFVLTLAMMTALGAAVPAMAENTYTATPTGQTVTLNGRQVDFAAYNIQGNNYFKLRDLAAALTGTEKNFNVEYNKAKDAVEITSLMPYIAGDFGNSGYQRSGNQTAVHSPQAMYVDGEAVTLEAYAVLDYNYCKLRDVAELMDFAVDWDPNTNTVNIGTDRGLDESVTVKKEKPVADASKLDAFTKKAVADVMAGIGPGTPEYSVMTDCEEEDWQQLQTDPYSSPRLSIFFDEYKKYGDLETFKSSVMSWLRNGGDDGVPHGEVYG